MGGTAVTLKRKDIDAVVFDMDGVVTKTATVHAAAWKKLFDAYLEQRAKTQDEPFRPFDAVVDYREYVDGKPRYDGVRDFLASRGIALPVGRARPTRPRPRPSAAWVTARTTTSTRSSPSRGSSRTRAQSRW